MRAAGVCGDVPTELGLLGGARVGRVEEAGLAGPAAEVGGDRARLDRGAPHAWIEVSDFFQVLEAQDHAAIERNGSAGEPGPAAPRDDRDVVLVAPGHCLGDIVGILREGDRVRFAAQVAALGGVAQVLARSAGKHRALPEERSQVAF